MIAVRNEVYTRTDVPHPACSVRIYQHDWFIIADIRCQPYQRSEESGIPWTYWGTEPGDIINGACNDEIFLYIGILVVCVMIPADHIRESIITVCLRIVCIVPFEKSPIGKGNRFKIFLGKYHLITPEFQRNMSFHGLKPERQVKFFSVRFCNKTDPGDSLFKAFFY
jgi:hypothetical protein